MTFTTLISADELYTHHQSPDWVVVDCRSSLADPGKGRRDYHQGHIPGAIFAHLEEDLSGEIIPGRTGRHPLPDPDFLADRFSAWGIAHGVQVVAYDDVRGGMAARLWWLLRWLGHDSVAVLDGGLPAWTERGYPLSQDVPTPRRRNFTARPRPELVAEVEDVDRYRRDDHYRVVDARAAERYRGEVEPIDPVAGHIPGAVNLPFADNLAPGGGFREREALKTHYRQQLGHTPPEHTVFYCGSGVTACHDILAYAHAGLGDARLYPGSWSEWITDPERGVATGGNEE